MTPPHPAGDMPVQLDRRERIRFAALRLALSCAAPNAATDQVFRQAEKYAAFLEGTPDQAEASP